MEMTVTEIIKLATDGGSVAVLFWFIWTQNNDSRTREKRLTDIIDSLKNEIAALKTAEVELRVKVDQLVDRARDKN